MFTGLVEHLGVVSELTSAPTGTELSVEAEAILHDCVVGDSISVNGTCLTVTQFTSTHAKFGVAPETLRRTSLGALKQGDKGHVDCVAEIVDRTPDGEAFAITFRPKDLTILRYVVEKGYICLDGASLTVTRVDDETFSVMIIAYTQQKITLGIKGVGDVVNVEVDQVGKYIERMIAPYMKKLEEKIAQLERAKA